MAADITPIFKATLKAIQTRNKALGRLGRESSTSPPPASSSLSSSPETTLFPFLKQQQRGAKSEFNVRAKEIVCKISKLREFLLRHRMDYIDIHGHLIFEQTRTMTDAERDQVDNNAQAVMRSCGEDLKQFKADLSREKSGQQLVEHRSLVLSLVDNYLRVVCKIYSEMKAVRVKRILDRKRLSRIGGGETRRVDDVNAGLRRRRQRLPSPEQDNGVGMENAASENDAAGVSDNSRVRLSPPSSPSPSSPLDHDPLNSNPLNNDNHPNNNNPNNNEPPSERGNLTWASSSFDEDDDDADRDDGVGNLSPAEIQMFEKENVQLMQELQNTTDDVKKIEGQVIEIARLQEIFSEKILEQEGDINRIGENLMGTTDNLQMGNEQIREAIKNAAGFRAWILFFLAVMSFSLLFLDWYND